MFNLLPNNKKKELLREYRLRFMTVVILMGLLVIVTSAIFLLPSYFVLQFRERELSEDLVLKKNHESSKEYERFRAIVKSTNADLKLLNTSEKLSARSHIEKVIEKKRGGVFINHFTITKKMGRDTTIIIGGVAKTRESLIQFTKNLESERQFSKVVLPVSNLAKSKDIPFVINISSK